MLDLALMPWNRHNWLDCGFLFPIRYRRTALWYIIRCSSVQDLHQDRDNNGYNNNSVSRPNKIFLT